MTTNKRAKMFYSLIINFNNGSDVVLKINSSYSRSEYPSFQSGIAADSYSRREGSFSTGLRKISCKHADCQCEKGSSFQSFGQNIQWVISYYTSWWQTNGLSSIMYFLALKDRKQSNGYSELISPMAAAPWKLANSASYLSALSNVVLNETFKCLMTFQADRLSLNRRISFFWHSWIKWYKVFVFVGCQRDCVRFRLLSFKR